MVKPQSSKLITRVRFPSSPPLRRLRRKRRGLLRSGDDGNPFRMRICFLARSESARSSSSSPRTNPSDVVGGIFCARGCRESLPGENTFPRALGIFALQPVIPSRTSLRESLPHADLFPRALGICTLQLVIPSTNPFRTLGNRLRRNPRPHPPFCWAFSGKTGKLGN